ncbi:hypothetical protein D477_010371 [Arthrobacter crystallopoietes BAB-32]|uniref:SipW-cognate class signal peptide n=1 Tax=Arthrobacter crystallopoietes BAB-32 TaxID=1246476 RepID=N1UZ38_9MICC|nr:hypothetical protein D477_010371 [Arthrobacter crystallopoietes BAB-32]
MLGVGAALTVAAWTDQEHATGTFQAGVFGIEGNPNGTGWGEHPSDELAASLKFSAGAMHPGSLQYAYLDVRRTASSTMAGTVSLTSSAGSGALAPYLKYRVAVVEEGVACDASTVSGDYLGANGVPVAGAAGVLATDTPVRYCFEVRLDLGTPNDMQGATGSISWGITGESTA